MLGYLIKATLEGALLYPPVAFIAWPAIVLGCVLRWHGGSSFHPREWLVVSPMLCTVILIAYGVIFNLEYGHSTNPWRERVVLIILGIQILASIIIIGKMKGLRAAASCSLLFEFCISAVAALETVMSVTNRWL